MSLLPGSCQLLTWPPASPAQRQWSKLCGWSERQEHVYDGLHTGKVIGSSAENQCQYKLLNDSVPPDAPDTYSCTALCQQ